MFIDKNLLLLAVLCQHIFDFAREITSEVFNCSKGGVNSKVLSLGMVSPVIGFVC